MRRLQRSERGLSEIVGTLILVVIVVSAATLLAAFVASYQKQLQTEESFSHDQSLESIHILGLSTSVSGGAFTGFTFTLASEYVNPSDVLGVSINGVPLLNFSWDNVSTSTTGSYKLGETWILQPFNQVIVTLDLKPSDPTFSFLNPSDVPVPNHYLKFDVYTGLQNDFTRVFLPPTPLAVASEIDPSGNNAITLLDGSSSFQPGGNSSIVNWNWTVTGGALSGAPSYVSSSDAISTQNGPITGSVSGTYSFTGTGSATFVGLPSQFAAWSGNLDYLLSPNTPLPTYYIAVGGSGCTPASASFANTAGSVSGTSATVDFSYSVVFQGCSTAPTGFQFSGTGDDVTMVTALTASGEECEVSPVLPVPGPGEVPYSVNLAVVNSDGLTGSVTLAYVPLT